MQLAVLPQFNILPDNSAFCSRLTKSRVKQVSKAVNTVTASKVINLRRLIVAKASGGSPLRPLKMFLSGSVSSAILQNKKKKKEKSSFLQLLEFPLPIVHRLVGGTDGPSVDVHAQTHDLNSVGGQVGPAKF